jgi:hypothetical protein
MGRFRSWIVALYLGSMQAERKNMLGCMGKSWLSALRLALLPSLKSKKQSWPLPVSWP